MEHTPPPLFRTGPTPLARLMIFSMLSVVLLIADARFNYLTFLRQVTAVIVYPLQRLAAAPAAIGGHISDFFVTHSSLRNDNQRLSQQNLELARETQQTRALQLENAHLRGLLAAREKLAVPATAAEILYAARDPFARKVMIDQGLQRDIEAGRPVVDHVGVIGQVTRVYPWLSEVTLITDKGHLVPVMNVRTGLRAVLAGTGDDGKLELRFIPLAADFQNGDRLVTSGIDGVYPAGLAVGTVLKIERDAAQSFARILCEPVAGIARGRHVLLLSPDSNLPPLPTEAGSGNERRDAPRRNRRKD